MLLANEYGEPILHVLAKRNNASVSSQIVSTALILAAVMLEGVTRSGNDDYALFMQTCSDERFAR